MANETKKPGLFSRIGNFFRESKSELKKVVWYPKKDVIRDTGIVTVSLVVTGVIIFFLDMGLMKLIALLGGQA